MNLTWDHVFPQGWYPDTTPKNVEKWKIPSCLPCNNEYSKLEGELLRLLGMCVDPNVPETAGIANRALRSMNTEFGRDERDKSRRKKTAERFVKKLTVGKNIPRHAAYPGLGERWGRPNEEGIAVSVPARYFYRLAEKIIRGIYFLEKHMFIEAPYVFEFYALTDDGAEPIGAFLDQFGSDFALEPGIKVRLASPSEDLLACIAEITIWRQFKMYASVMPEK